MDTMFEVPGSTVSCVFINEDVVNGVISPIYEHKKETVIKESSQGSI